MAHATASRVSWTDSLSGASADPTEALDAVAWLLVRILPERKQPADPSLPRHLDETALDTPPLAITNAARETLRMGDTVEVMLH